MQSNGGNTTYLAKLDPQGKYVWAQRNSGGSHEPRGIAIRTAGPVLVGSYGTNLEVGEAVQTLVGVNKSEGFALAFDDLGTDVWSKNVTGMDDQLLYDAATDVNSNVFAVGWNKGTVSVGGSSFTNTGLTDTLVAKFDKNGAHQWSNAFGGSGAVAATKIRVDSQQNVLVAGIFNGTADFGGADIMAPVGSMYLLKLSNSGNYVWSRPFAVSGFQATDVDGDNNVVLAGAFGGEVSFGQEAVVSLGLLDPFIAKLNADGNEVWAISLPVGPNPGGNEAATILDVAIDPLGNIAAVGNFAGALQLDGQVYQADTFDTFVLKLGPDGTVLWFRRFPSPAGSQSGFSRVLAPKPDTIIAGGSFDVGSDLGLGPITTGGVTVAKFVVP